MEVILIGVAALLVPTLALAGLLYLGLWATGRRPERYWRRTLYLHLVLIPVHAVLVIPGALGFLASRLVDTRPDERAYAGPRIEDGTWQIQSRYTLEDEAVAEVDPAVIAASEALGVSFESDDETQLHGYLVEPRGQPVVSVVMVHGLFRNAMELETVGSMFWRGGAEVLLVELRRHGGSERRGPFTFGLREAEDVKAAVKFLRDRPGRENDPVVLFGVSLGTAAVALAAPQIDNLAGVVLDAPMDDLLSTAHRMLGRSRGRVLAIPNPFRSLVIRSMELWSGFRMSEVRPIEALGKLDADIPILLIGAGQDERMPPDSVGAIYDSLQAPPGVKELWFCEEAEHGKVWEAEPQTYQERIARFLPRTHP